MWVPVASSAKGLASARSAIVDVLAWDPELVTHQHDRQPHDHGSTASHFDERAPDWDSDPEKVARATDIALAISGAVPLTPQTRLLEYGAGTGLVTQHLQDAVGAVTLADSSVGMLDQLRAKAASGVLPDARIWALDLTGQPPPDEQFDIIVCSLVLHHIPDLGVVLDAFAALLAPGGYLCIAELDHEDGSFHDDHLDVHHGFDQQAMTDLLERHDFHTVSFTTATTMDREGKDYPVFLAVASR